MGKILRAWTFWIRTELRGECSDHLDATVLQRIRAAEGNQRAAALFRDLNDGTTEVVVVSVWDSMESIQAYAGDPHTAPGIDPRDVPKLFDREPTVRHYAISSIPTEWTLPE
ncbi:MAG: antibiotic biosynthesis monooxygenase [Variovorax sp.]|nr:antibiotic biosynthesis monooxygenase [Variovorax sp.]